MRLLFFGDLATTGFGTVTADLGRRFVDQGIDVRFVSQNDLQDELPEPFRSRTVDLTTLVQVGVGPQAGVGAVSDGLDALLTGTARAMLHNGTPYGSWVPDVCLILGDFASVRFIVAPFAKAFADVPTFHYVPIEGVGLPPSWAGLYKLLRPVAMSEFGADQIEQLTGSRPAVVYHGVDTEQFRPIGRTSPVILTSAGKAASLLTTRDECKQAWAGLLAEANGLKRVPKRWMLRTDRHMPRKRYNALLRALTPVLEKHPDWALVIHCAVNDQGGNLLDAKSKLPESVRDQVLLTGQPGLSRDLLRSLYCAADLYVSISAEGFGLTIAEALACGIPAVGIDYSAVPEVIGPAGVTVPVKGLLDNEFDHYWAAVDEDALRRSVEFLMTHQAKREDLGRRGPSHIASTFRWDAAADQFAELFRSAVRTEVAA